MASPGPVPPASAGPRAPPQPPPRGGRGGLLLWLGLGVVAAGGYYLYTSGGNTADARRKAESDARKAAGKTIDAVERAGDKIDRAYDNAKNQVESSYKSTKADLQKEYNKEKTEAEKKLETYSKSSSNAHPTPAEPPWLEGNSMEEGGRWYGAFGGFGGLGLWASKVDDDAQWAVNKTKESVSKLRK